MIFPHCTHLIQPLDLTVFGEFKKHINQNKYKYNKMIIKDLKNENNIKSFTNSEIKRYNLVKLKQIVLELPVIIIIYNKDG